MIGNDDVRDAVVAGAVASVLSGVPSTLHALAHKINPLEASLAAGTLLLPREERMSRLLPAAMAAHGALSLGWALALAACLPRGREPRVVGARAGSRSPRSTSASSAGASRASARCRSCRRCSTTSPTRRRSGSCSAAGARRAGR